jgi:hypothetical protein
MRCLDVVGIAIFAVIMLDGLFRTSHQVSEDVVVDEGVGVQGLGCTEGTFYVLWVQDDEHFLACAVEEEGVSVAVSIAN